MSTQARSAGPSPSGGGATRTTAGAPLDVRDAEAVRDAAVRLAAQEPKHPPLPEPKPLFGGDSLARAARRCAQALIVLAAAYLLVRGLIAVRVVVIPVLIGLILAAALQPAVSALVRRRVPAVLATWVVLLVGLGVIGGMLYAVVRSLASQWDELATSATEGFDELLVLAGDLGLPIDQVAVSDLQDRAIDALRENQATLTSGAFSGAATIAELLSGLILVFVIVFYLLEDGPGIGSFLLRFVHHDRRQRAALAGQRSMSTLAGYARGTAIVAVADAVLIGIALVLLDVPLALPLALVVFLSAFVPLIGAVLAGVLCVLVALVTVGPLAALIVLGVVVGVNQIEGNILAPIVFGKSLSLHPLVILLALAAGTVLGGIVGAVLSVPTAAVAWAVVSTWWPRVSHPRGEDPDDAREQAVELDEQERQVEAATVGHEAKPDSPGAKLKRALSTGGRSGR